MPSRQSGTDKLPRKQPWRHERGMSPSHFLSPMQCHHMGSFLISSGHLSIFAKRSFHSACADTRIDTESGMFRYSVVFPSGELPRGPAFSRSLPASFGTEAKRNGYLSAYRLQQGLCTCLHVPALGLDHQPSLTLILLIRYHLTLIAGAPS